MRRKLLSNLKQIMKRTLFICMAVFVLSCEKTQIDPVIYNNFQDIESMKIEVEGDSVSLEQAESIAKLFNIGRRTKSAENIEIGNSFLIEDSSRSSTLYVINFEGNNGYVIVGSSKKYAPILAYSEVGNFDENYAETAISIWLNEQFENIEYFNTNTGSVNKFIDDWNQFEKYINVPGFETKSGSLNSVRDAFVSQMESQGYICHPLNEQPKDLSDDAYYSFCQSASGIANPDYDYMSNSIIVESVTNRANVDTGVLMSTVWEQGGSFNDAISGDMAVGCTALAVAQIMKYHQFPLNYSWNSMEDDYATSATQAFLSEVHDEINWWIAQETSDPWSAKSYLRDKGYSNASVQSHNMSVVEDNLVLRRPVLMSGASGTIGHSWVCDGFRTSSYNKEFYLYVLSVVTPLQYENTGQSYFASVGNGSYYHMNWGWGGDYDGWYLGDNANPGSDNYSWMRTEVVDIYPLN